MLLRLWTRHLPLAASFAVLMSVPVTGTISPSPARAITPPENPNFTVQIGSSATQLQVVFTPTSGISRYSVRMYSSWDNYDNAVIFQMNYQSGQDIGLGNQPGFCNGDQVCIAISNNRGVRFTIQGYDSSNNPVTNQSPKSLPYFQTTDQVPSLSSPNTTPTSLIRVPFSPQTGQTSLSIRLYRSDDNYSQIYREVTDIVAPGRDIEVPGGYSYKFAYRTIGSTQNSNAYLSSAWRLRPDQISVGVRPNPPGNVQLTGSNRSFTATWTASQPVNGVTVYQYFVGFSSDRISWTDYSTTNTTDTISNLTNGQPYWVRVRSIGGNSTFGEWMSPTPVVPSYRPGIPSLSLVAGDKRIDTKWLAPDDGGAPILNYLLQYSTDGTSWIDITVDATKRSHSITGLTNGTQYTVRIYAINNSGISVTNQSPIRATPAGNAIPLTSPVTKIDTSRASLAMTVDTQGNTLTPYLEFGTPDGFNSTFYGDPGKGDNVQLKKDVTGLTPGYVYRVRSGVVVGGVPSYGTEFSFSTTPDPPSGLAATMTGTTASVSWTLNPTNNGNYIVYQVWAELNGVESGNRCRTFTGGGNNCQITGLTPGKFYAIKATAQPTGANYGNQTSLPASIQRSTLAPQEIDFSFINLPRKGVSSLGTLFDVSQYGSSSSGLVVTYTSTTSSKCVVVGTELEIRQSGTCTIRASQSGNSKFAAATSVDASFVIAASQTISFSISSIGTQTFGGSSLNLSTRATASSGLTVSFTTSTSSICTVADTTVTYLGAGTCRIIASQLGDTDYDPAPNVAREITVTRGTQSSLSVSSTTGTFGTELLLTTTGGSGSGIVTYAVDTNSVLATASGCSITSDGLVSTSAGQCAVIATKSADINYVAKSSVSTLVTLQKAAQTISFTPIAGSGSLLQGGTTTATARSTSGLSVTISSDTASKCTVSGGQVSLLADGICTLRGTQAGNSNFNAATPVTTSFEISPKPIPDTSAIEYIRLTAPNSYKVGDVVQLSIPRATYQGSVVSGTYEFISTSPEGFFFGNPSIDGDGTTRATVTFTKANAAFNLYAVFTPTDRANFAQAQTFAAITVNAKPQTITVNSGMDQFNRTLPINFAGIESTGTVFIDLSPMTSQGQPVNIQDQQAHCTISNQTVTRDNPGYCYVRVSSMGDGVFDSSLGIGTFVFTKLTQSINVLNTNQLNLLTAENAGDTIDLAEIITASSTLTVAITSSTPSTCTMSSLVLTVVSAGLCDLAIEQSGNDSYQPASSYSYSFTILRLEQSALSLTSTNATFGSALLLTATGGSGTGNFNYTVRNGLASGCSVQNGILTSATAGSCLVTVTRAGDSTYFPKSTPPALVEVGRSSQVISFNLSSLGTVSPSALPINLSAFVSTTSGLPIALRSNDSDICSLSGPLLTVRGVGSCSITASQDGTENFEPASDVVQSFSIAEIAPTPVVSTPTQAPVAPVTASQAQSGPNVPAKVEIGRTIKFAMKAPSGLPLSVSASGACKVTKVTRKVTSRVKVGKKWTTRTSVVQTGWSLTFSKRGKCTMRFRNGGDATYLPLSTTRTVTVK